MAWLVFVFATAQAKCLYFQRWKKIKILKTSLTRLEDNFTDHDPTGCEVKLDFHETAETSVQVDGNISCILQHCIRHVCVDQWPSIVVLPAHAEQYLCFSKHLLTQFNTLFTSARLFDYLTLLLQLYGLSTMGLKQFLNHINRVKNSI